jgi:hypothetical protein
VSWATGTFEALNCSTVGGVIPGGRIRRIVCPTAVIWAMAPPISTPGWKYTLMIPIPSIACDSMRSMSPTVVENARSLM